MIPGLSIRFGDEPLETAVSDYSTLELLSTGDGTEVVRWSVKQGGRLGLTPNEAWNGCEFFYILQGTLRGEVDHQPVTLQGGSILSASQLTEPIIFNADEDSVILYVTSQPTFYMVSQQVQDLMGLAVEVEEKDEYTAGHCRRIRDLSVMVGEQLKLPPSAMHRLTFGAFLHDIGKCKIPKEILNKSGKLTDEEWLTVKEHPRLGRELVDKTCIREAGPVIEQHHERLDGSGYPLGLRGSEILVEAQIVAVVDSFDAMTTDRPYRKGQPTAWAMDELRQGSGKLYAPEIVDALGRVVQTMSAGGSTMTKRRKWMAVVTIGLVLALVPATTSMAFLSSLLKPVNNVCSNVYRGVESLLGVSLDLEYILYDLQENTVHGTITDLTGIAIPHGYIVVDACGQKIPIDPPVVYNDLFN